MTETKQQGQNSARTKTVITGDALEVATVEEALQQVEVVQGELIEDSLSKEDIDKANNFISKLVNKDFDNPDLLIESVGTDEVKQLQSLSKSLEGPIANMINENSESAKIGKGLIDLKVKVEEINPGKFDFEPGWFGRIFGKITGNSSMNKYFSKFQSTKSVIEAINRSLEEGKMSLIEDNAIFNDDKKRYRETTKVLNNKIKILVYTDEKLSEKANSLTDGDEKTFIENEILYPLRLQIQDLQQTLAVTSQGVIALDILIKNNTELIRGVKRTQNVTMTALTIGATVAGGLATQKRVLETTKEVNNVTNDIIAQNAHLLKTQGAEIQKQASSAMLDMDKLKKALEDTVSAIEDIETFKSKALPQMKSSIDQLNSMNAQVEKKIERMEASEKVKIS
jgi:uncharacterized protein YaaN involved in tellurite resistance